VISNTVTQGQELSASDRRNRQQKWAVDLPSGAAGVRAGWSELPLTTSGALPVGPLRFTQKGLSGASVPHSLPLQ